MGTICFKGRKINPQTIKNLQEIYRNSTGNRNHTVDYINSWYGFGWYAIDELGYIHTYLGHNISSVKGVLAYID